MSEEFVQISLDRYDRLKENQVDFNKIRFKEKDIEDGDIEIMLHEDTISYLDSIVRQKFEQEYAGENLEYGRIRVYDWDNILRNKYGN